MHKKSFVAVLCVGLLLLTGTVFANIVPQGDEDFYLRVQGPSQDKSPNVTATPLPSDPAVTMQGGTPRVVPGTFCDGEWQGGVAWIIGGWHWGAEIYASYQDPDGGLPNSFGTCDVPTNYPFDVTAINMYPYMREAAVIDMQPLVWDADLSSPGCPIPGGLICAGPVYTYAFPGGGLFFISMAFNVECCVGEPYFASNFVQTFTGPGVMDLVGDDFGDLPTLACRSYDDWGSGWADLMFDIGFTWNLYLYSEGYTPDDAATHCTPGICDYQIYYPGIPPGDILDGWNAAYGLPSGQYGGRMELGVRYSAIGLDTLKSASFLLYGPFTSSPPPDIELRVYHADGGPSAECGKPTPGTQVIPPIVIPGGSLNFYPVPTTVVLPDLLFGTLNGGTPEEFFITIQITAASDLAGLGTAFAAYGGDPGCVADMNSLAFYPNYDPDGDDPIGDLGPNWVYIGGRNFGASGHAEFILDAYICAEEVPIEEVACDAVKSVADQWPTWQHDYQRTGASSINIGDPNEITLEWSQKMTAIMNHTVPTVAGDIVYASQDDALIAYDLGNMGNILGTLSGFPEMGALNRGNTTVHGGRVYATGGSFKAITALNADLSVIHWSNNANNAALLNDQNRFNTSIVIDIGGTDVLILVTEPSGVGDQGEMYAFDASDGSLFGDWGVNPVPLYAAGRHSPTYDGTNLYVGSAAPSLNDGRIEAFLASDGSLLWAFEDQPDAGDPDTWGGFPGGCSVEGDFLYAASNDLNDAGRRFKLDKSGAAPTVVWQTVGSATQYAAPTIGRNFVYITQIGAPGVLMVDKSIGLAVYNFAADGVGRVTSNVAMSCDNFLFVGDLNARWWVLSADDLEASFFRQFPVTGGTVNGTALASHSGGGDYAVVGVQAIDFTFVGQVIAYRIGAGARPRLVMNQATEDVSVPLNSGSGIPHTVPDLFENVGGSILTFSSATVDDISGAASASIRRDAKKHYLDNNPYAQVEPMVENWSQYSRENLTKRQIMSGLGTARVENGEYTSYEYDRYIKPLRQSAETSARGQTRLAAGAAIQRTDVSSITIGGSSLPATLAAGDPAAEMAWSYDGTGLGRGLDNEIIEITNDDPDFDLTIGSSVAALDVVYIGGCADASTDVLFNATDPDDAGAHVEPMYNFGIQGDTYWDDDPQGQTTNLYEGGILIAGDSINAAAPDGGALMRNAFYDWNQSASARRFVADTRVSDGACGFDRQDDIKLGDIKGAGIPGTPDEVRGEWVQSSYSDTNMIADPTSLQACVGFQVIQTEVAAYHPALGNFKVIRWELKDRPDPNTPVANPLVAGTFMDWDVTNDYLSNVGLASSMFNGYAIWDEIGTGNAYGMADLDQGAAYAGADPTSNPPRNIVITDNAALIYPGGDWNGPSTVANTYNHLMNLMPAVTDDYPAGSPATGDKSAVLTREVTVPDGGSGAFHQVIFGIDASSNDAAVIEADATDVVQAAARWAGFARGDVNEDGYTDLADVLWMLLVAAPTAGYQNYPADYNADVDGISGLSGGDISYLMNWVSAAGPAPVGDWRFDK